MTRSKVSPDGKIADRDVSAKLVIIMVGLPARGKSYLTKKITRYLSWQQHNTRIFNVGNRRRVAAGVHPTAMPAGQTQTTEVNGRLRAASILLNGVTAPEEPTALDLNQPQDSEETVLTTAINPPPPEEDDEGLDVNHNLDQSAKFFDPNNRAARALREKVALATLDELLDYLVLGNGAVGILDATNSTIHRRDLLVSKIREREPKLGILFIESICRDKTVRYFCSVT